MDIYLEVRVQISPRLLVLLLGFARFYFVPQAGYEYVSGGPRLVQFSPPRTRGCSCELTLGVSSEQEQAREVVRVLGLP